MITIHLLIIGLSNDYSKGESYLFSGVCTLLSAILAIFGVCLTIYFNQKTKARELYESEKLKNKELLNELDQKSEWRKELMNVASKPILQIEDVYRILASLRFLPKSKDEIEGNKNLKESEQKDFDIISNYIYIQLNKIINKYYSELNPIIVYSENDLNKILSIKDSEKIRLYTKFLLKHHWEYNKGEEDKEKFKKKELDEFRKVITFLNNDYSNEDYPSFYYIELGKPIKTTYYSEVTQKTINKYWYIGTLKINTNL